MVGSMAPTAAPTAIIGDVHGCGEELRELLDDLDRALGRPRLILAGDLLTKGPTPHLVVTELLERRHRGQEIRLVCGNHDQRMLVALVRIQGGGDPDHLPRSERQCWHVLQKRRVVSDALKLLIEANETVEIRGGSTAQPWTVLHGGIEPRLGLMRTPDQVKIHLKAEEGEAHWWERYRGEDGLIIVGHKPLLEPMVLRRDERPIVVDIDTGCAYGNALSAYLPSEDRLFAVPSRQERGEQFRALKTADAQGSTRRQREMIARRG